MAPVSPLPAPSLTLVIPGLLWPNPALQDTVFDLPLPALQTLLGRSTLERVDEDESAWWQRRLGSPLAPAPLRRLAMGNTSAADHEAKPDTGPWLCADLVHLRFEEHTLVLEDPAKLQLSREERQALAAVIAPLVEEFGHLELSGPALGLDYWHLRPHGDLPPCPPLLSELIGQPARALLPEGSEHRPWRRLFNEIQMVLHQHPLNQAREAAGLAVVNSLALWGGGSLPSSTPAVGFSLVLSDEAFHHGLARHWHLDAQPLPQDFSPALVPAQAQALAYTTTLVTPTRSRDALRWREGLKALETHWFAPLLQALDRGQLRHLQLVGFGNDGPRAASLTATTGRWAKLKFWQAPRPLTELHP
jgi:hypothetical protein